MGSQSVPYIYEDFVKNENITAAIEQIYNLSIDEKNRLSKKVLDYANHEFLYQNTIDKWHETMLTTIQRFKESKSSWTIDTF